MKIKLDYVTLGTIGHKYVGCHFTGTIKDMEVSGRISMSTRGRIHLLTNEPYCDGDRPRDMMGYRFGWHVDRYCKNIEITETAGYLIEVTD